ncbi:hypothetical protein NS96R_14105 [Pseudomonas parafulva]|uniref:Uncharacterized protein n=1 Tax=Pseudomonas parafulva TaxID=157782 RepID=A0AAJ0LIP4_9PSED|nr:hypothetical protein NS96R_14105 [Pseudomonas parafulva]
MSQSVQQAEAALAAANEAFMDEMERDAARGEGSGRLEILREKRQRGLSAEVDRCEQALEAARRGESD